MANRQFQTPRTQLHEGTFLPVVFSPAGTGAPVLGEGDSAGSYFTITRNSVGNYTLKTKDAYPAIVVPFVETTSGFAAKVGQPSQNADGTWSIPVLTTNTATSVSMATTSVTVTGGGSGYTGQPTLAYNNAHGNTGLKITWTIAAGAITAGQVTDGGFGSDGTAPTITLSGGGGSGATATVTLGTGVAADVPAAAGAKVYMHVIVRNSSVKP